MAGWLAGDRRMTSHGIRFFWILPAMFIVVWGGVCSPVGAQDPWEYTPYRIHLWVLFAKNAELPESLRRSVERQIVDRADAVVGSPWELIPSSPPSILVSDLISRL